MTDRPLAALSLAMAKQVPFWYSLTPLPKRPGLRLLMLKKTWLQAFVLNTHVSSCFRLVSLDDHWVQADLPFKAKDVQSQQRTLAYLLNSISITNQEFIIKDRYQLAACDILLSVPEMKGYLMTACISYEMKLLLRNPNAAEAMAHAKQAMKKTARSLQLPIVAKYCCAYTEEGLLFFGIGDGSGSCFGPHYLDRSMGESAPAGYRMDSDNIDCPELQLVFLSGLAAVVEWGEQQTQAS